MGPLIRLGVGFAVVACLQAEVAAEPAGGKPEPGDATVCRNLLPADYGNLVPTSVAGLTDVMAGVWVIRTHVMAWQFYFVGECVVARRFAQMSTSLAEQHQRAQFGDLRRDRPLVGERSNTYLIALTRSPRVDPPCETRELGPDISCAVDDWLERRDPKGMCAFAMRRDAWFVDDFPKVLQAHFAFDASVCPQPSSVSGLGCRMSSGKGRAQTPPR